MRFFKTNSYDIVRLYINQIGIAIFSLVLLTAAGLLDFDSGSIALSIKVGVSVFTTLFYLMLIYNVMWECGAKDAIRVASGKVESSTLKGLFMSLFANIPNFVLSVFSFVTIGLAMLGTAGQLFKSLFAFFNLIMRMHESMYLGMIQGLTTGLSGDVDFLVESLLFIIVPVISIGVSHLGYLLGTKEKKLLSIFTDRSKKN